MGRETEVVASSDAIRAAAEDSVIEHKQKIDEPFPSSLTKKKSDDGVTTTTTSLEISEKVSARRQRRSDDRVTSVEDERAGASPGEESEREQLDQETECDNDVDFVAVGEYLPDAQSSAPIVYADGDPRNHQRSPELKEEKDNDEDDDNNADTNQNISNAHHRPSPPKPPTLPPPQEETTFECALCECFGCVCCRCCQTSSVPQPPDYPVSYSPSQNAMQR